MSFATWIASAKPYLASLMGCSVVWLVVRNSSICGEQPVAQPLPNPAAQQLQGVDFVELREVGHQFLIRRVPEKELDLPGKEIAVIRVAKDFVRIRLVYRKADGSTDYDHERCDYWIPFSSIIAVVDEFPPQKDSDQPSFRVRSSFR